MFLSFRPCRPATGARQAPHLRRRAVAAYAPRGYRPSARRYARHGPGAAERAFRMVRAPCRPRQGAAAGSPGSRSRRPLTLAACRLPSRALRVLLLSPGTRGSASARMSLAGTRSWPSSCTRCSRPRAFASFTPPSACLVRAARRRSRPARTLRARLACALRPGRLGSPLTRPPPPACAEKTKHNAREWEEKYLHACANSAIAIPLVSRHTFKGRNFDMTKYVWSSNPDELLMEWDLMLELYDRGRLKDILPMLVGDLTDAQKQRAQSRIMQKLRIDSLDEKHVTHRLRELFNFADKDRSGFIDRDELAECFKRFGLGLTDDELDDLLENADDGDCEIDVFEFEDLIMQLLEDKAGVILRPEKSKQKHANLSREDTIKAIKHASSPLAMREAGFSPDGSTVRKSPKSPGARSPGASSPGAKKNSSNVSNASPAVDRSEGSSRPGTRGDPLGGSRPATRGEAIQEEDGEGREDAGFKSAAGDKFKRATSADLEDMWKQLEEDGAEVSAPSSPLRSENPEFYTDFSESGCAPPMTSTVVAQAQRRITAWLHHDLKYGTNEVLWRAKHCRPVPSMDSESGGRTIKQTVECILGFPAHKVAGMANAQLERMLKAAHKCWELAVKLPAPVLKKGVPRPKEVLCETTGRPAKYVDPLTLVPFRDMHTFHQRRQCFYFDIKRCHEDIIMENHGTRVTCTQSAGRSVMLTPPIGAIGTSVHSLSALYPVVC